jgi:hypothetical protein
MVRRLGVIVKKYIPEIIEFPFSKNHMKKLQLYWMVCFLCGCSNFIDERPAANLTYVSIQKNSSNAGAEGLYDIYFNSNINIFENNEKYKIGSTNLFCSLSEGADFLERRGYGLLTELSIQENTNQASNTGKEKFHYKSSSRFIDLSMHTFPDAYLSKEKVRDLLAKSNEAIACRIIQTHQFTKPYQSNAMEMPSIDILKILNN